MWMWWRSQGRFGQVGPEAPRGRCRSEINSSSPIAPRVALTPPVCSAACRAPRRSRPVSGPDLRPGRSHRRQPRCPDRVAREGGPAGHPSPHRPRERHRPGRPPAGPASVRAPGSARAPGLDDRLPAPEWTRWEVGAACASAWIATGSTGARPTTRWSVSTAHPISPPIPACAQDSPPSTFRSGIYPAAGSVWSGMCAPVRISARTPAVGSDCARVLPCRHDKRAAAKRTVVGW